MSHAFIVVKYRDEGRTYEVFESIDDLLKFIVQETKLGSKIAIWQFGDCVGDFS